MQCTLNPRAQICVSFDTLLSYQRYNSPHPAPTILLGRTESCRNIDFCCRIEGNAVLCNGYSIHGMIGLYVDSSVSICPFPIAITISFDFVTLPNNRLFHSLIGFKILLGGTRTIKNTLPVIWTPVSYLLPAGVELQRISLPFTCTPK